MTGRELREWQRWRNQKPPFQFWPRCGLCRRVKFFGRRLLVTGDGMMTIRVCDECAPVVKAADLRGVVQAVDAEFSTAWNQMLRAA